MLSITTTRPMGITAYGLTQWISDGKINFDIAIQRGHVWDNQRDSLLIHSMMMRFPINFFHFVHDVEQDTFEGLDGKQRSLAIYGFLTDGYELNEKTPDVIMENGDAVSIAGLKFSQLPSELKREVENYSLSVLFYDGVSDDEVSEIFYRLNNGQPFKAIEKTRAKTKSIQEFQEIAEHKVISGALTTRAKDTFKHEKIAMQMWTLAFTDHRDFLDKSFSPMIENVTVTDGQKSEIFKSLDYVDSLYTSLRERVNDKVTGAKTIFSKVKTQTNMTSLFHMAHFGRTQLGLSVEDFCVIAEKFFTTKSGSGASVSSDYNKSTAAGSGDKTKVEMRIREITNFLKGELRTSTTPKETEDGAT